MNEVPPSILDEKLRNVLGSPARPDFEAWRHRHGDAVAHLNPVVTEIVRRRQRMFARIASLAAAALVIAAVTAWLFAPQQELFAQAARAIDEARTATWTMTSYQRR